MVIIVQMMIGVIGVRHLCIFEIGLAWVVAEHLLVASGRQPVFRSLAFIDL